MAPVGSYPTGAIALYGEGGVWRLIARALNMRVVYGRSVADNLGIQAPAVSRVACGGQGALSLTSSAALCISCATGLNRGLHDVQ